MIIVALFIGKTMLHDLYMEQFFSCCWCGPSSKRQNYYDVMKWTW